MLEYLSAVFSGFFFAFAFGRISPKIRMTMVKIMVFSRFARVGFTINFANKYPAIEVQAMFTKLLKVKMQERVLSKFSAI